MGSRSGRRGSAVPHRDGFRSSPTGSSSISGSTLEVRSLRTAKSLLAELRERATVAELKQQDQALATKELKETLDELSFVAAGAVDAQEETNEIVQQLSSRVEDLELLVKAQAKAMVDLQFGKESYVQEVKEEISTIRGRLEKHMHDTQSQREQLLKIVGGMQQQLVRLDHMASQASEGIDSLTTRINQSVGSSEGQLNDFAEVLSVMERQQLRHKLDLSYLETRCTKLEEQDGADRYGRFKSEITDRVSKLAAEIAQYRKMTLDVQNEQALASQETSRNVDLLRVQLRDEIHRVGKAISQVQMILRRNNYFESDSLIDSRMSLGISNLSR